MFINLTCNTPNYNFHINGKEGIGLKLLAILPLLLSFCNKAVIPLVNRLGTKPLSKHSLSCDLTLPRKVLKFFNQNPWTKSRPGDFQFDILKRIFFKLSLVISTFSWFVTLTSLCKSFNHFASLL